MTQGATTPAVCRRIREARVRRKLSQYQLSKLIDTHPSQVSQWETHHAPPVAALARIASALGVTTDSLILGYGDEAGSGVADG